MLEELNTQIDEFYVCIILLKYSFESTFDLKTEKKKKINRLVLVYVCQTALISKLVSLKTVLILDAWWLFYSPNVSLHCFNTK